MVAMRSCFLHSGINSSIDNADNIGAPQNILFLLPNSLVRHKDILIYFGNSQLLLPNNCIE